MEGLRQYVVSAVSAALICSVVTHITKNSGFSNIVRVLCGLFMTIVLLHPVCGLRDNTWNFLTEEWEQQSESISAGGLRSADSMKAEIIKQQTEAYILEKAAAMNAAVEVRISVGDNCVPVSARISGSVSPMTKSRLEDILTSELGISGEHQQWIG